MSTPTYALHLVTNPGYDSILLTDHAGRVVSEWGVDDEVLANFLRDGGAPEIWDVQNPEGLETAEQDPRPAAIEDWGTLVLTRTAEGLTIHDEHEAQGRADFYDLTEWAHA